MRDELARWLGNERAKAGQREYGVMIFESIQIKTVLIYSLKSF
jgi:hypothetical protein